MRQHGLGLIGAGEFGNFASFVIEQLPDCRFVAAADTNEEATLSLSKKYNLRVYNDFHQLLHDPEVEAILINTPNFLHAEMAKAAILAGKKVISEKPLGISAIEITDVVSTLKNKRGVLLVNFLLPHHHFYQKIKESIDKKTWGKLKYISVLNLATESTIKTEWYWDREKSGGWFLTASVHFYDLFDFLLGAKAENITAKEYVSDNKTEAVYTSIDYGNCQASIFHDFTAGYKRAGLEARFIFEKAEIIIRGWIPTEMIIISKEGTQTIRENEDREAVYQSLIAKNIRDLAVLDHNQSLEQIERTRRALATAFAAQEYADKIGRKNG